MSKEKPPIFQLSDEQLNLVVEKIIERTPNSALKLCDSEPAIGALANIVTVAVEKRVVRAQKGITLVFALVGLFFAAMGYSSWKDFSVSLQAAKINFERGLNDKVSPTFRTRRFNFL